MLPVRHARSPSTDRPGGRESRTGGRSRDRAGAPLGPAAPGWRSLCAYRCARSRATPARRSEPGSSPLQDLEDARERLRVNRLLDNNAPSPRQHDLNAPLIGPGRGRRDLGWLGRRFRHDHSRNEARPRGLGLKRSPPAQEEGARDAVTPCRGGDEPRHGQALHHDLELLVFAEATTSARLDHLEAAERPELTTVHTRCSQRASPHPAKRPPPEEYDALPWCAAHSTPQVRQIAWLAWEKIAKQDRPL